MDAPTELVARSIDLFYKRLVPTGLLGVNGIWLTDLFLYQYILSAMPFQIISLASIFYALQQPIAYSLLPKSVAIGDITNKPGLYFLAPIEAISCRRQIKRKAGTRLY